MGTIKIYAPNEYWSDKQFISNGCGAGWNAPIIPDNILGIDITIACNIHDWMYLHGDTIDDKNTADRVFLNNMTRLIMAKTWFKPLRPLRLFIAKIYYEAVVRFGGPFFWDEKNEQSEMQEI